MLRQKTRRLANRFETLESRLLLTGIGFVEHLYGTAGATVLASEDLDGDSDMDLVVSVGRPFPFRTAWFENIDGKGTFEERSAFGNSRVSHAFAQDIDGDDDKDVVTISHFGMVAWHENRGNANFGGERVIGESKKFESTLGFDYDFDGDTDVFVSGSESDQLMLFEFDSDLSNFATGRVVAELSLTQAIDMDQDGDTDLVATNGWIENVDEAFDFTQVNQLALGRRSPISTAMVTLT